MELTFHNLYVIIRLSFLDKVQMLTQMILKQGYITPILCNATAATCGAGTAYSSGAPELTPSFSGVRVARSLVFCVVFRRSLFVLLSIFL